MIKFEIYFFYVGPSHHSSVWTHSSVSGQYIEHISYIKMRKFWNIYFGDVFLPSAWDCLIRRDFLIKWPYRSQVSRFFLKFLKIFWSRPKIFFEIFFLFFFKIRENGAFWCVGHFFWNFFRFSKFLKFLRCFENFWPNQKKSKIFFSSKIENRWKFFFEIVVKCDKNKIWKKILLQFGFLWILAKIFYD